MVTKEKEIETFCPASRQEVRELGFLPQNQRFEFTRGLENVRNQADFIQNINGLNRQVEESQFYANAYDPRKPQTFADFNKRFSGDDTSNVGMQIREAIEDIRKFSRIGLEGTGVEGKAIIADKILSVIPSRDDLLKRINNPQTSGDAEYLLSQQASAFGVKRDFEKVRFDNLLEQQKFGDLRRTDALEQLNLLKNSTGLDREFQLKNILNITGELGTPNLNKDLLEGRRAALLESAKIDEQKAKQEQQLNTKIETFIDAMTKLLGAKGLKVETNGGEAQNVTVEVTDGTSGGIKVSGAVASNDDTRTYYEQYQNQR